MQQPSQSAKSCHEAVGRPSPWVTSSRAASARSSASMLARRRDSQNSRAACQALTNGGARRADPPYPGLQNGRRPACQERRASWPAGRLLCVVIG
jgi:hypothetical protein